MDETVQVIVRARPSTSPDQSECVNISEDASTISIHRDRKGTAEFRFNNVLGPSSSQSDLYSRCGNIVSSVVDGINCCIMVYGQTSTGKTYSMFGDEWLDAGLGSTRASAANLESSLEEDADDDLNAASLSSSITIDQSQMGLVPRCVEDLFLQLESLSRTKDHFNYTVHCQFLQIYNEKIYDLILDKKKKNPLTIKQTGAGESSSVRIAGISEYRCSSRDDVIQLLRKALGNRALRATELNADSSRSHSLLQLFVRTESSNKKNVVTIRESTFSLVDLAGSEKSSFLSNSVESLRETTNINTSLYVLGKCVSALTESNRKHIPFRDSQLTRLLQDSLNGNGHTVLVTTIHADLRHAEETYNSLQFASRASKIKVSIVPSEVVTELTVEQARKEVKLLRARLRDYELQQNKETECVVCKASVEKLQALESVNRELRSKSEAQEEQIAALQRTVAELREMPRSSDVLRTPTQAMTTVKLSASVDKLSAIHEERSSGLRGDTRACTKHDLVDCVLCQLYSSGANSLLRSPSPRKQLVPMSSSSKSVLSTSTHRERKFEAHMDPHGTPLMPNHPVSRATDTCATHRVASCLLCSNRGASQVNPSFTPIHEHFEVSSSQRSLLPKLDATTLDSARSIQQPFKDSAAMSHASKDTSKTSQRYRYQDLEDDLVSEITMFHEDQSQTVQAVNRLPTIPAKSLTRKKASTGEQNVLAAYLPALKKTKKKKLKNKQAAAASTAR